MTGHSRVGFMQGRLSPAVEGRIQAFPWANWRDEFSGAQNHGFALMEWTLDQERLYENPLLTAEGQAEIRTLCARHVVAVPSLTGDCFMQAPFWKVRGAERVKLQRDFHAVVGACTEIGTTTIVLPLVDKGRLETRAQEDALVEHLEGLEDFLDRNHLRVVFESDYLPAELVRFIERLKPTLFGVNYDMGNSAAAGLVPCEEIEAYGHRITNVHVKDRVRGGTTVPLGTGSTDFNAVFAALGRIGFRGNYILQTARAVDDDHAAVLTRYRDMTVEWMTRHGA